MNTHSLMGLARAVVAAVVALSAHQVLANESAGAGISAVWREQQIDFTFFGGGSVYTCAALEKKIRAILLDLGARDELEVDVKACLDEFRRGAATGSTRSGGRQDAPGFEFQGTTDAHVSITLTTIAEAMPEILREVEAIRGQEELKSRVRGDAGLEVEPAVRLLAQRKQVRFSGHTRYLDPGDCDLIEQLRANVLSRLDVRIVRDASTCNRRSFSLRLGQPNLTVETLVPLAIEQPAEGRSAQDPL